MTLSPDDVVAVDSRRVTDNREFVYRTFGVVGEAIVLYQEYMAEQTWFPFMSGCILYNAPVSDKQSATRFFNMEFTFSGEAISDVDRINRGGVCTYVPDEEGVYQRVLPFHEYRHVTEGDLSALYRGDFASFDRDENDEVYCFEYKPGDHNALLLWADENCIGRYIVHNGYFYVEREEDAVPARLRVS
jgi:hypothetical protein